MSWLRQATHAAPRVLLGSIFLTFGVNYFAPFLPHPPMEAAPLAFVGALLASGYVMPIVKGVEVVAALLLLSNRFVPLALALLAPIVVSIVGFHVALAPQGLAMGLVVLGLELLLAWRHRAAFAPMLQARAEVEAHPPRRASTATASA